jgi:hypothetical protein
MEASPVVLVGLLLLFPLLALGFAPLPTDMADVKGSKPGARSIHVTCGHIATSRSDRGTLHYDLAVVTVFKNEADIMEEWLEHHIWQGVQHFYLLDNNSTDNIQSVLRPYITAGFITMCHTPSVSPQEQGLDHLRKLFAEDCTWLMQIDIDEFMFSTVSGMNLHDVLATRYHPNTNIAMITVPWHHFGSSGLKTQPDCIRSSFTMKMKFDPSYYPKYIVRGKCASKLTTHSAEFNVLCRDTKSVVNPPEIKLYHYRIMSEERYRRVKMGRGDVYMPEWDSKRNMESFVENDFKDEEDNTLKDMIGPYGCYPMKHKNLNKIGSNS